MPGDYNKLPRWARELIEERGQMIGELRRQLADLRGRNTKSRVYYDRYTTDKDSTPTYLPSRTVVTFQLGPREADRIDVGVKDGELHVYGERLVQVMPRSGNCIYLTLVSRP